MPCLFIITAVFCFYLPTKLYDFTILATAVNIHYLTFVSFYLFLTKSTVFNLFPALLFIKQHSSSIDIDEERC